MKLYYWHSEKQFEAAMRLVADDCSPQVFEINGKTYTELTSTDIPKAFGMTTNL